MSKRNNIGNIVRSCSAFGASAVFVAGRKKDTMFYGSHGTRNKLPIRFFDSLAEVRAHCAERGIHVCGIEILAEARPVHSHPWRGPTAFILGNEGQGLTQREKDACDSFVYISHYGSGTASLNVTVAGSIVLHHYGLWAGFAERPREGEKYVVTADGADPEQQHGDSGGGVGGSGGVSGGGSGGVDGAEPAPQLLSASDIALRQARVERRQREAAEAAAAMDSAACVLPAATPTTTVAGAEDVDAGW